MKAPLAAILLLLALPLAGCLSDEPGATPGSAPNQASDNETVTDTGSPLDAAGATGAGSRAHKHDYWGGKTEIVLADADFTPTEPCGYWNPTEADNQLRMGCISVEMGNGSVVYQGTSKLTLTATWNDPKVTGLTLFYRDAKQAHEEPIQLASGTPLEIPVDMETADMAHSKTSKWAFDLYGGGSAPAGVALEKVHVTITIYRGLDLPLDPPHPDFWGANTTLEVANMSGTLAPPPPSFLIFIFDGDGLRLPEGAIIPPGTTSLDVDFTYKFKDPAPGITYHVFPVYKSAEHPFWNNPEEHEEDPAAGTLSYSVSVTPAMTDSPYAKESQWEFAFLQYHTVGAEGLEIGLPTSGIGNNPFDREMEYTLRLVAHGGHDMNAMTEA